MAHLRKLLAAAALATAALFGAPGQQAQATTLMESQTAVIGEDYTSNIAPIGPNSVPIGPTTYTFTFAPAAADAVLTATFGFIQLSGTLTGGYIAWGTEIVPLAQALVAGTTGTLTASIPLSAAGPSQTLTVGFDGQSGTTVLAGGVSVTAIPLPASGLLLLAGLGAVALVRRRAAKLAA